jgi:hypothetical protein
MKINIENFEIILNGIKYDEEKLLIIIGKVKLNYNDFYLFLSNSLKRKIEIPNDDEELLDVIDQNIVYMNFTNNPLIIKNTASDICKMLLYNYERLDQNWLKSKFLNLKSNNNYYEYLYLIVKNLNNIKKKLFFDNNISNEKNNLFYNLIDIYYNFKI